MIVWHTAPKTAQPLRTLMVTCHAQQFCTLASPLISCSSFRSSSGSFFAAALSLYRSPSYLSSSTSAALCRYPLVCSSAKQTGYLRPGRQAHAHTLAHMWTCAHTRTLAFATL